MTKQYKCLAQVHIDGLYVIGETVELSDEQAEALGDCVRLVTKAKDEPEAFFPTDEDKAPAVITTKSKTKPKG